MGRVFSFIKRLFKRLVVVALLIALYTVVARTLMPLPDISQRAPQNAIPANIETRLGKIHFEAEQSTRSLSGVRALAAGSDALLARLALIDAAQVSIDAQYYIWHDDTSGIMLLHALDQAAQRGVRVRLLLDDNGIPGLDGIIATLNAHENFDIRLFNPSVIRRPKFLGYSFDFMRMNRRMHNKSMIVDGAAAIIGGRNIGDEYFEIGESFYKDMDAFAIGAIVPETARIFDAYWNAQSVYQVETLIDREADRPAFDRRVTTVMTSLDAQNVLETLKRQSAHLIGTDRLEWTKVQVVADDPIKGTGTARDDQLMIFRLSSILGEINERLDLVSAYFIPGKKGTEIFGDLAQSGRTVNILTNALNTTDVLLVHSGYTKYRRELLESGVSLYELRLRGGVSQGSDAKLFPLGLSGASLHAKTFAVDGKRVFIGSFNFDPRSARLNCEMGFLIESPSMAQEVSAGFDGPLAAVSYKPELTGDNRMVWQETKANGDVITWQQEPGASFFQQVALAVIGLLPVEWAL